MPIKIQNTTLVAAITNQGYMGYQLFNKGIKSTDFLGFMSNLTQMLRRSHNRRKRVKVSEDQEQGGPQPEG